MSDDSDVPDRPADRESPVGEPVVRADPSVTGERADDAVGFDPDDPESVQLAADVVRSFAENTVGSEDHVYMLRGAAACAALVRGVGSYKAAAERAGGDVSVAFIRKWARVHDLPQAIRRHVARGTIAPTAAKHIARVAGDDRYALAWATLEHSLTVREIRRLASQVSDGRTVEAALADRELTFGHMGVTLPPAQYIELRRRASIENRDPDELVTEALDEFLEL